MRDVRRREFITLLGGGAAWPRAARAQQPERIRRIAVLMAHPESNGQAFLAAFQEGLQKLGWTEDRNIRIDARWARPGDVEARQQFAKELVALEPDLILRMPRPPRLPCCNKRAPFPSFSPPFPIRSAAASSRAFRGRAATSPVSPILSRRWPASGWSCSRRLRRASPGGRPITATPPIP